MPDVRLLVGPRSCTCTSPFTSRQSCHVSSPYFKQLILGLWFGFCFTFHELLGLQLHVQLGLQLRVPLQLRRLLRWSSIGAREGFCLLCLLSLEPWINKNFFKGQGQQVVWPTPPRRPAAAGAPSFKPAHGPSLFHLVFIVVRRNNWWSMGSKVGKKHGESTSHARYFLLPL